MSLKSRWSSEGGYREVLAISIPLILSTASMSIQRFVDRVFLSHYSQEALAAVTPAGLATFTVMCLFLGTASYTTTFVAQYTGAGEPKRAGAAVWQAVYFSLFSMILLWTLYPFAPALFKLLGHSPAIRELEITYFQVLILGAGIPVISSSLAGFFAGKGETKIVMWANILTTITNIILDYGLIFGNFGFPELGIKGAAIATVISSGVALCLYLIIFLSRKNDQKNATRTARFNPELFKRLMRYGFPSGLQFFFDLLGFTTFVILVGRIGEIELIASNIAFSINLLSFMPMMGFSIGTSSLVGQALGMNKPSMAEKSTMSALHLTMTYMAVIAFIFVFFPDPLLNLFRPDNSGENFGMVIHTSRVLLKFAAAFCLFDTFFLVLVAALKGAGDTQYIMKSMIFFSCVLLIIPSYIVVEVLHLGLYSAWSVITFYICFLGMYFLRRYRKGLWKTMRVIEHPIPTPTLIEETPIVET